MIPALHSIDLLLNRFDELSQRHASLVRNLDTNSIQIKTPTPDENEPRKTPEDLLNIIIANNERIGSSETIEELNRGIPKNRPPSYSSNDSSFYHRIPSRTSWATGESVAPPPVSIRHGTAQTSNSSVTPATSSDDLIEPRRRVMTKTKIVPSNPPPMRRNARSAITIFTMETAIRLSRPRTYHRLPEPIVTPKRVHRRSKPSQIMKKELSASSIASVSVAPPPPPPKIKRTNPTITRSSPKKHKSDTSKRIPTSNNPRPLVFLAPAPTIHLTFPMQPELKSSRSVVTPKAYPITPISTKKTYSIFTNKRTIIPPNRWKYLVS